MRRTLAAGGVAMVLLAGACSNRNGSQTGAKVPSGDGASGATTTTTADAGATTPVAAVSYEVPEVIDQAYVQRVVSAYDKVLGDAIRVLKRDGAVNEDFLEHLLAIYTEEEFNFQQKVWLEEVAGGRVSKTPPNPGNPAGRVVALRLVESGCIVLRYERDYVPTLNPGETQVGPEHDYYLVLVRRDETRDPRRFNPTPWAIAFDGSKGDNSAPLDRCGV